MWKVFYYLTLLVLMCCESDCDRNNIISDEINNLSDLNLSELLRIRTNLEKFTKNFEKCNLLVSQKMNKNDQQIIEDRTLKSLSESNGDNLSALPLVSEIRNNDKTIKRSYEHHSWDEKPSKLQTIFQLSITALSFLAFGGYLLCMIVQAIKSKGTTYYHPVATTMPQTNITPLKKIKVYRRQRRSFKIQNLTINSDQIALPDPNEMYNSLILLAEGYVKLSADI